MRAEVHAIEANDISAWPEWRPSSPADELQWFTVSLGPVGHHGSDLFQIVVATPAGLRERKKKEKFVGLIVDRFEPSLVEQAIQNFVADCEANTWEETVNNLRSRMHWEYENYR